MARLYDTLKWLETNGKPSWKITLNLCPMHIEEDAQKIASEQHDLTGKEAHHIFSLWRGYEDELPAAGEAIGIDNLCLSVAKVTVRVPQRNGGNIKFSMTYDHHEDSWFDSYNPPDSAKDKPVQFAELKKMVEKKYPTKKKPVRKPTQVLKMAAWLERLSPQNRSVEVSFDKSPVKIFTRKNWQDLVETIKSNPEAEMIDLVIKAKGTSSTRIAYAVYQDRQWQSMPAKDVELLYSVDVKKREYVRPGKSLKFASFKTVYPDSPAHKELVDLGVKSAKKKPARKPRKA